MSNRTDLLDHPDLSKVWLALESAASILEMENLVPDATEASLRRSRRPRKRLIAAGAAFLMVIFVGTETFGVVSARRAIAAGVVVTDGVVDLEMTEDQVSEPWSGLRTPLGLHDLEVRPEGIVAMASETEGDPQSWLLGVDGWTMIEDVEYPIDWGATVGHGSIAQSATDGETTVFTGVTEESLLFPDGNPTIWTRTDGETLKTADVPSLRSLGFGYLIGGFRLPEGIEHVIHTDSGFVAYTGYLQVWDGFEGLTLEPREAWASLVLTSNDGQEWTPHVLSDFAIYQMVPFGNGMVAAAGLPPGSDTVIIDVDGVPTEVAVTVENRLFYSEDGLRWEAIADSPRFGKPLLAPTVDGRVIVVDEYQAEDQESPTTEAFIVEPPPTTAD
jgi:hypothetical protein